MKDIYIKIQDFRLCSLIFRLKGSIYPFKGQFEEQKHEFAVVWYSRGPILSCPILAGPVLACLAMCLSVPTEAL